MTADLDRRRWFQRKRLVVPVFVVVVLLVMAAVPGGAHALGFLAGTAARLARDAYLSVF